MKKKLILLLSIALSALLIGTISVVINNEKSLFSINAKDDSYRLVMNSSKNKLHSNTGSTAYSGSTDVKTNLDNNVEIIYTDLMGLDSTWHVIKNGGGFYNSTPIHGLDSIALSFKTSDKDFKLYYSFDGLFDDDKSITLVSSSEEASLYEFNNTKPSYFKFVNIGGSNLNISEVILEYSCQNYYPTLTTSCEETSMGSVSGSSGTIKCGTEATIVATPNQGYRFVGWYDGDELVSNSASYSFIMGYEDLNYVAKFVNETYSLVVESESLNKGSVSNSSGSYDYLDNITIEATANDGYSFAGWYKGSLLISNSNPYAFNMPYENTIYVAKFSANSYQINLSNSDPSLGTITGEGAYFYKSSVTLTATPNVGVSFLGWYDDDDLVSNLSVYTFTMPHEDLTYVARFSWTPYSVQLSVNNLDAGSVTGGGSYIYQQEVMLVATPNEHYSFFGWYDGDDLLSKESTYVFDMPANSLDYEARFVQNHNLYIYSDDASKGTVSYPNEWGEGLEVTINANAETGYALDYWYDEDLNEASYDFSYTFVMPNHDVTLYAAFTTGYTLTVTSSDMSKGTVSGGGQYPAGRTVTLRMNYLFGTFVGWFGNNELISENNPFNFLMPSNNYLIEAKFLTQEEWDVVHGVSPSTYTEDEADRVIYGLYPQTHVSDIGLSAHLDLIEKPGLNGWYYYHGEYYCKAYANPHQGSAKRFINGDLVENKFYWFKCEPIHWYVCGNNENGLILLSKSILDVGCFYHDSSNRLIGGKTIFPNNYKYSDIRTWLNEYFYSQAFKLDDSYIQLTEVDNSAKTTNSETNPYFCDNTNDKVFLLSYKECGAGCCSVTDYAIANGISYIENFLSGFLTRSPSENSATLISTTSNYGGSERYYVGDTTHGVMPAISIKI